MKDKINSSLDWIRQHTIHKQFIPTKKDLENKELKKIKDRLKSNYINKSLINILEWQDRNIKGWDERGITSGILTSLISISILIISLYFGKTNPLMYLLLILIPIVIMGNVTLNIGLYLIALILSVLFIPLSLAFFLPSFNINSNIFLVFLAFSFILGALISLLLNLFLKYRGLKNYIPNFNIGDTFKLSLPIDEILRYRLSICRDYAKLTSALLLKIYPEKEVYFILIPKHVAAGIKLNNKLYILDQKLPILALDNWKEKWKKRFKKKDLKVDFVKIYLRDGCVETKSVKYKDIVSKNNLNIKTLNDQIIRSLKLFNKKPTRKENLEFPLKNFESFYSQDELVENSLIEAIKNKIEDELVGNIDNLNYVDLVKKDKEIILKIWLKDETKNKIQTN